MEAAEITGKRIRAYLDEGKRFDGRTPEEFRDIIIETGVSKNAEGSARVKLGNTEVLVGVKMAIAEPYPDSADQGNLMIGAELLALSSDRFESGPPSFESIEIGRVIDRCVRESKIIDLKKLCIKEGEKVWTVMVDVYSINDDGNLLDAAGIGAIAALKNTIMPFYDEKTGKIDYHIKGKEKLPMIEKTPFSITVHKIGKHFIVDPTRQEEDLSETRITMGIMDDVVSSIQKGNSESLSIEEVEKILDLIERVGKDLNKKALKA